MQKCSYFCKCPSHCYAFSGQGTAKWDQLSSKLKTDPKVETVPGKQQGAAFAAVGSGLVFLFVLVVILKYRSCWQGMSPHTLVAHVCWGHMLAVWSGHPSLERGVGPGLSRAGMLVTAHPALLQECFNEAAGSSELAALDYTVSPPVTPREALSEAGVVELWGSWCGMLSHAAVCEKIKVCLSWHQVLAPHPCSGPAVQLLAGGQQGRCLGELGYFH